ncbi:MAG: hypothetical protein JXN64_02010 [Spirochaetes bacterium]|nr:hypothetical protein [Spirochaetota bacterium]
MDKSLIKYAFHENTFDFIEIKIALVEIRIDKPESKPDLGKSNMLWCKTDMICRTSKWFGSISILITGKSRWIQLNPSGYYAYPL